jgi:NAD+-processing family protein with receiver domain
VAKKIVILEDNSRRRQAMQECLADRFYQFESHFFDRPAELATYLEKHLPETVVICLHHDLEPVEQGGKRLDPGTGRDIADFLAQRPPVCPVVVHSTNATAVTGMESVLRDAGLANLPGHALRGPRVDSNALVSGGSPRHRAANARRLASGND